MEIRPITPNEWKYTYSQSMFAERMEKNGAAYEPMQQEPQAVKPPKHKDLEL